ncbi:MAG: hypothetical protein ACUVTX_10205 [Bacteroidales bacterium]
MDYSGGMAGGLPYSKYPQHAGKNLEKTEKDFAGPAKASLKVKICSSYNGSLTYIHKVKDNRNIWFFSNSSGKVVDTFALLRDSCDVSLWDPMKGEIKQVNETFIRDKSEKTPYEAPVAA